jgi:hypothetical protein
MMLSAQQHELHVVPAAQQLLLANDELVCCCGLCCLLHTMLLAYSKCSAAVPYAVHCREEQRQWRQEDIEQRHLDNARALWARVVEKNRRDVEEKSEQLKAISTLAALISGFALSAFLQFDFGDFVDTSGAVLPLFGVTMALTVSRGGLVERRGVHLAWFRAWYILQYIVQQTWLRDVCATAVACARRG